MNRKLKKLIKTPRLYFVDMFKKMHAKGELPKIFSPLLKIQGNHKFSVVSAVYGVEKYLEQYLSSLENQTLNFSDHIELIMVDDGSLDGSANIIKKWAGKYPDNIKYVKKENGGQASARNVGMEHVSHEWVTFIDPDDFLSVNYFAGVDRFLSKENDMAMVSCNFIFYIENKDVFSDSHPLKYRFNNQELILDVNNMRRHVQLSVNSAFFKTEIIRNNNLEMDSRIKPNFEDAHFIGKYLLSANDLRAGFLKDPKYYYRKREDNSSTLDGGWQKETMFFEKLKYGDLELLEYAENKLGEIPEYIQRIVLYDLFCYVRYIVNNSSKLSFLTMEQKEVFLMLLKDIFSNLDTDVIDRFDLAGCWFYHKVGMLGLFKDEKPPFQIIYIEDFDVDKKLVQLKYYYRGPLSLESFQFDGVDTIPSYTKTQTHDFLDETFVNERIIWLPISSVATTLMASIGNEKVRLSIAKKQHHNGVKSSLIINHFKNKALNDTGFPSSIRLLRNNAKSMSARNLYQNAWLLMDRDVQADDNAEHLYRYLMENHSEVNVFFVLRQNSHDWDRLQKEGFKLLDFNTEAHKLALLNSDHVISSHADGYVISLLQKKYFSDLLSYRYTFLQHGIIQNDLSNWLNNKPIDLFVTSTAQEFASIAYDNNRYKYSGREVLLTGLPRHDALLQLNDRIDTEKLIVIMPTWRQGIVGTASGQGNERSLNEEFYASDYAQCWKSFLHSDELKHSVNTHGFKVIFFPHVNIKPYLDWFETPDYIQTITHGDIDSMQYLFCCAALMITDYSSVAFEMAYINKAIIYYQFDYDFVFGGGHLTSKGYYDYEKDGFGPVCFEQNQVLDALALVLDNNGLSQQKYLDRMKNTFVYKDGLCCQRVFESILNIKK